MTIGRMAIFLNQRWTSLRPARAAFLIGAGLTFALPVFIAVAGAIAGESFSCVTDASSGWITSLRRAGDAGGPEFLRPGQSLGPVVLRLRTGDSPWREVRQGGDDVGLSSRFQTQGDALRWEIRVANTGRQTLEIGDPPGRNRACTMRAMRPESTGVSRWRLR